MGIKGLALFASVLVALGLLAGCGGSSSTSSQSGASSTAESEGTETSGASEGSEGAGRSEGSSVSSPPAPGFSKKAKLAAFGEEASAAEREEASEILERSLEARAAGDYPTQCATLAKAVIEAIEKAQYKQDCVGTLTIEDTLIPPRKTVNTMRGPIAALRVQGTTGYALYHGKGGQDYAMRMELENGKWKVGEVLTVKLP